jgi:hypothetical protein
MTQEHKKQKRAQQILFNDLMRDLRVASGRDNIQININSVAGMYTYSWIESLCCRGH